MSCVPEPSPSTCVPSHWVQLTS